MKFSKNRFSGFKTVENCVSGKFFEIVSWVFPRSTHQGASIELSFVLFASVGASEVQSHQKKTRLYNLVITVQNRKNKILAGYFLSRIFKIALYETLKSIPYKDRKPRRAVFSVDRQFFEVPIAFLGCFYRPVFWSNKNRRIAKHGAFY